MHWSIWETIVAKSAACWLILITLVVSQEVGAFQWPQLLLTVQKSAKDFEILLVDPNTNSSSRTVVKDNRLNEQVKLPVSVGSAISGIVCHEQWTFSCRTIKDDKNVDFNVLIGIDDSADHLKHVLHLDMNPYDGAHVMYLEPIRQAVWILNLLKNKGKLIGTFDDQNIVNIKVDWTNGLLFTRNTSTVSIFGIQTDKLEFHRSFEANATYLACDSELRLLYWTDASGFIYKRHYDQPEVELLADSACMKPYLYVYNSSVVCIRRSDARTLELKRFGETNTSKILEVDASPETLLHYNVYTDIPFDGFWEEVQKTCAKCSHLCVPVNNTKRFECACPYGFRLLDEFHCDTSAVLALRVEVSKENRDAPEGATHALLLHDFMAVAPSSETYAYETSSFRIILSDTFERLCLQFSSNQSVECFSPFSGNDNLSREIIWKAGKDDIVTKVSGDSETGFHVFLFRNFCLRVHRTKTNRTYALDCQSQSEYNTKNTFIDHLRYKIYYPTQGGLNVQDPAVQFGNGFDENFKLSSNNATAKRQRHLYVDVETERALFFPGQDDSLYLIQLRNGSFLKRRVGSGDTQSQASIYRDKILWADDFRILVTDIEKTAGAEFIKTSKDIGTEFTIVEKPTGEAKTPNPCRSQTECPHLCKADEELRSYECLCPLYWALNGADVCEPSNLHFALLKNGDKFTLHSNIVGDFGNGKVVNVHDFPSLFRFGEIFLHELELKRVCVAHCRIDGCAIECTTYGLNAKLQKISTDSTIILQMVNRHSGLKRSDDNLYWISDESRNELNRLCLNVGSPNRKYSMKMACFAETALMQSPNFVDHWNTLFWLKRGPSAQECQLRSFSVGPKFANVSEVLNVAKIPGNCYSLAVVPKAGKFFIMTWFGLYEFDVATTTQRKIRGIDFNPSMNILKEYNDFIFTVGRKHNVDDTYLVKMIGPVSKTGNILNIYKSSKGQNVVDIHISPVEEKIENATSSGRGCNGLSCRHHCESGDEQTEARCVCPLMAPPIYGTQYQPCSEEETLEEDSSSSKDSAAADGATPWWSIVLGVAVIIGLAGVIQALFWRRMKHRQDLLFQRAIQNFMEGSEVKAQTAKNESERALHLPFTAVIPPDELKTTGTCLGEGNFGQVYKGEYKEQQVAVKTVKDNLDSEVVRDFLKELKIMAYVGMHEHIVEFFGAEVSEIQKGLVKVVLELCGYGSLESVLRGFSRIDGAAKPSSYISVLGDEDKEELDERARPAHPLADEVIDLKENTGHVYKNWDGVGKPPLGQTVTVGQLKKWAWQIAVGMEYLERKNVVHGDLATRNVLVCDDLSVKISDFGFSKNMYQSETYRKKKACPLPWRWASPETLNRLEFSFKADVWSYGVTVWEIFTLGAVPYPDLTWDNEFVNKIQDGLRPPKPHQMPAELYQNVLVPCWNGSPSERPSFNSIAKLWV